jgi:acetyl/propionyl-CoA carboxylase alpha subunit
MLKAAAGGGGKGMRVVRSANELSTAFSMAEAEAESSFGILRSTSRS